MSTNTAEYMRDYRARTKGIHVRVQHRAERIALKLIRDNTPDLWGDCLDQAWQELAGRAPQVRRPRKVAQ